MQSLHFSIYILFFLIALALLFDFMSGYQDAAQSIATVVSTGVLKPYSAVIMAAVFNVGAYLVFDLHVAKTVGLQTINTAVVDQHVVFGALVGAITLNIVTWYYGIPSSSTHALIGSLVGATVAKAGVTSLVASGLLKTVAFIILAPLLGFALGSFLMLVVAWTFVKTPLRTADKMLRSLQMVSAALYSLGHGGNNAQKTMGVIWMLLIAAGSQSAAEDLPSWVVISCYVTIGLGTLFGGWRVVRTMGQKITKLRPAGGFCAEAGGAATLFLATAMGIPVSTTHTITGAIIGVGSTTKLSAVRWGVAGNIVWAWILTIPASAFMAAVAWWIGTLIF